MMPVLPKGLSRSDFLWFNPSQQLSPTQLLTHSESAGPAELLMENFAIEFQDARFVLFEFD